MAKGKQAEAGFHKILAAAAKERERLAGESALLKRAVAKHHERNTELAATVSQQEARVQQLSTVAQNLYTRNQALEAQVAALGGNGADMSTGLHFPKYGDVR